MAAPYALTRQTAETTHKGEIRLSGSFIPNTAGTPAAAGIRGNWIASVAHTNTGIWTITIKAGYRGLRGLISAHCSLQLASAALSFVQLGAIDLAAGTVVVCNFTEGAGTLALADIAANANNRICVELVCKWLPVKDGSGIA